MKEFWENWLLIAFLIVVIIALIMNFLAIYYSLLKKNQVKAEKWFNSKILFYSLTIAVIIAFIGWISFGLKYEVGFSNIFLLNN